MKRVLHFIWILLFQQMAYSSEIDIAPSLNLKPIQNKKVGALKQVPLLFQFEQNLFYGNSLRPNNSEMHTQLGFNSFLVSEKKDKKLDIQYFYMNEEAAHYVNLREMFISWGDAEKVSISFGRKKNNWNSADSIWQQGIWQPRFMWSRVRPEQNGLTGLFLEHKKSNWHVTVLASPIHIPEMGPQFKYSNNRIQSTNPWFLAPASSATVEGLFENKEIIYELNQPEISDVVLQNSAAVQFKWVDGPRFCQTSFAYKPLNGILNSVDLQLRIDLPTSPPGVEVFPYTDYHRVTSLECGWESDRGWYGFVSAAQDKPLQSTRPSHLVSKRLDDSQVISSLIGYKWSNKEIYFTNWRLTGGESLDSGERASAETSFFDNWYDYKNSFRFAFRETNTWKKYRLSWDAGLTWEAQQEGWVWTSSIEFQPASKWAVFAKWDTVNLLPGSNSLNQSQFINNFKANDQASMGVNFVF
jgi:hypothetical protein